MSHLMQSVPPTEIGKVRCVRSLLWPNHAIACLKASFNNLLQNHLYHTELLRRLFETKLISRVLLGIFCYVNSIIDDCFLFIYREISITTTTQNVTKILSD